MNFKLKALVATIALAAVAGQAAAAIAPGKVTGTESELVFFAYGLDADGNAATYVKDLGVTFSEFVAAPSFAKVDLDSDANWTSFMSAGVEGSRFWGVYATQRNAGGATAANTYKMLTTATADDIAIIDNSPLYNNSLVNGSNAANNGIIAINGLDTDYATDSSYFYDFGAGGNANLGAYLGTSYFDSFVPSVNEMDGVTTAKFWAVAKAAGAMNVGIPTYADVSEGSVWSLNAANELVYAPVPEPETYAMLLAGLGLMGVVARRRRAV